jgi:2-hydroxymuconate-semialdehyde hydrolase
MSDLVTKQLTIDGCTAAYYEGGTPGKLPLLLMHGLGPGAAVGSAFAFIIDFLCEHFHVFATDLIGFGGSGQKPAKPYFDFPLWVRQARAVVDRMPGERLGVFGHSASGAIALRLAATDPRVAAVITTGTAGTRFDVNEHLRRLWTFPRSREELRLALRSLLFDASQVPEAMLDLRWSTLQAPGYRDYFEAMFSGDLQQLADSWVIADDELARIEVPYTLVHGRNDLPCPAADTSLVLAEKIRHSSVVLLADCGHAPAAEHPAEVCAAVRLAFTRCVEFGAR